MEKIKTTNCEIKSKPQNITINNKNIRIYEVTHTNSKGGGNRYNEKIFRVLFASTSWHNCEITKDCKMKSNKIIPLNKKMKQKEWINIYLIAKDINDLLKENLVDWIAIANREVNSIKKTNEINPSYWKKILSHKDMKEKIKKWDF